MTHLNKAHRAIALLAEAELAISRLPGEQLPQAVLEDAKGVATRRRRRGEVPDIQRIDGRVLVAPVTTT